MFFTDLPGFPPIPVSTTFDLFQEHGGETGMTRPFSLALPAIASLAAGALQTYRPARARGLPAGKRQDARRRRPAAAAASLGNCGVGADPGSREAAGGGTRYPL
ncbi:hypothetical protein [Burkholderia glumae]|uniref:hypothetical protein n=1 Tax=Burkholderia glumae TaxID=337 RepID=UPI00129668E2|nr:hypothetical protein [Burkholderia glumae]MCM2551722.1 hypothetical protein [Burkholderia glumae]MCR1768690.1 hypothetical protein [Burkholderia glumae]NVE25327.1 hypothetical protein [Burkholderia glumae]QGA41349.1 hypothetical protein GAS19_28685 [Burkholderia glumae]QHP93059.1 hypothetical protein EXE55_19095 [Burkholderia glumae]